MHPRFSKQFTNNFIHLLAQIGLAIFFTGGLAANPPAVPAGSRFVMSHFKGNVSGGDERLFISVSADGLSWTALNGGNPVWQPVDWAGWTNVVRDPAIIYSNGFYWVAYTSGNYGKHASFGLVKSADLLNWTFVGEISTVLPEAADPLTWDPLTWGPTFFQDSDGSVHLFIAISPVNGSTYSPVPALRSYELHPLNADWSQWSAPVAVELPSSNTNEFLVWKEGDLYHGIYIDFNLPDRGRWFHVVSNNLLHGWSNTQKLGFATQEGGMLIKKPEGGYRFYLEPGNSATPAGYRYTDCDDTFTGFGPQQLVQADVPMRNGKITALAGVATYASWRAEKLAGLATAEQLPEADPDRDGLVNLIEYSSDLNPRARDLLGTPISDVVQSGGGNFLGLSFRRLPQVADASLSAEVSGDLATWESASTALIMRSVTLMSDGTELVSVRDSTEVGAAAGRFIRLNAKLE